MPSPRLPLLPTILAALAATSYALSLVVVKALLITPDPITGSFTLGYDLLSVKIALIICLVTAAIMIYASLYLTYIADCSGVSWPLMASMVLVMASILLTIMFPPTNIPLPWNQTPLVLAAIGAIIFSGWLAWKGTHGMMISSQ